jgi:hypothetical protein
MLREFDNYVLPGSEAWLMPAQDKEVFTEFIKTEVGSLKHLKLKFVEGDPTMPEALRKVASPDFAVAMVVADTSRPPDEADARTVISVLLLRDLFRHFKGQRPRIISEILDPRTKDLLEQDYGADFVVSAEMTSMLLAQVSERRELRDALVAVGGVVSVSAPRLFVLRRTAAGWREVAALRYRTTPHQPASAMLRVSSQTSNLSRFERKGVAPRIGEEMRNTGPRSSS